MEQQRAMSEAGWAALIGSWLVIACVLAVVGYGYLHMLKPLQREHDKTLIGLATAQESQKSLRKQLDDLLDAQSELTVAITRRDEELRALKATEQELIGKLQSEIDQGNIAISQNRGQIVVDLVDKILFPSGESELSEPGKEILRQVGETFLKVPDKVIQVGGHTDNVPISPKLAGRFPSNWELSAARSLNVVRYLQDTVRVPGERLVAAGFSQYRPIARNDSAAGRKKNRRIEVVLLPVPTPER